MKNIAGCMFIMITKCLFKYSEKVSTSYLSKQSVRKVGILFLFFFPFGFVGERPKD